jgi:hypothetical protein
VMRSVPPAMTFMSPAEAIRRYQPASRITRLSALYRHVESTRSKRLFAAA